MISNLPKEGVTLTRLGDAHYGDGDVPAAFASWRLALDILSDLHHPDAESLRAKLYEPMGASGLQDVP